MHFIGAEYHGQLLFPAWAHQIKRRPFSPECMPVEELDAAQRNGVGTGRSMLDIQEVEKVLA